MSNGAPDPFNEVMTRESLVAMIQGLCDDFRRRGEEWENRTVEDYLDALAAWITDSPGSYRNLGEEMPSGGDWTFFARALSAAVVYE
ncbi:hypothetical protein [Streptomyces sp. NPDC058872]|uniref:DUF7660 family protein n=1 Tax=Streptomyces sp. NPDC058872 TaxID=3346661 RepID=UPI0036BD107B